MTEAFIELLISVGLTKLEILVDEDGNVSGALLIIYNFSWRIFDNKRLGYNGGNNWLYANLTNVEDSPNTLDLVSNGFKNRSITTDQNTSGGTYIYAAFAENPFVSATAIPTTAR